MEAIAGHRAEVIRALVRRFGSRELAEDAVQDALLVAARSGAAPASPGAWLHVVAHRRAIDAIRSRQAEPPATVAGCASDPAEQLLRSEGVREVLGELSTLPARQRRALELAALEGRSPAEIGADLLIHESAAKALVYRARSTLRARLAERALTCAEVRELVRDAAERGVRSPHRVQRHLGGCAACGALRPRRDRLGVWAILTARWWPVGAESTLSSLGAKGCASVCAVAIAGTAPPVMVLEPPAADARKEQPARPRRAEPVPVVVAAAAPQERPRARTVTEPPASARRPVTDTSAGRADKHLARALAACYESNSQRCRREAEGAARAAGISREDLWASRREAADSAGLSPIARAKQAARDQRRAHKQREPVKAERTPPDASSAAPPPAATAPAAATPLAAAPSTPPAADAPPPATTPAPPAAADTPPPAADTTPPTDTATPTGAEPSPAAAPSSNAPNGTR